MRLPCDATLKGGVLVFGLCAVALAAVPRASIAQGATSSAPTAAAVAPVVTTELAVPTRDGSRLVGRLLTSSTAGSITSGGRRDVLLELRAGRAAEPESLAAGLARRGWPVVVVEPRAGSEREMDRLGRDGSDVVEWVARQPWATGKVLMFGSGDAAVAQWATAQQRPSHLVAIAPRAPTRGWWNGPADSSRMTLPVLSWGPGFIEPQGALIDSYQRHVEAVSSAAAQLHYLAIGSIGPLDQVLLLDGWGRWATGRDALPALLHKRVNYMMDDGTWFSVDSIGAIGTQTLGYPLHAPELEGAAATKGIGFLGGPTEEIERIDTVGTSGEFRYETMGFEASADLLGRPTVTIWMRGASRGTPEVVMEEIRGNGDVQLLGRARGRVRTVVTEGGGASRWEFVAFPWIARRVLADSRVRLTIRGVPGAEVLHDREHYSRVILPLVGNGRRAPGAAGRRPGD